MTVTIHIEDRLAKALAAQAEAAGLSLEEFAERVLSGAAPTGAKASADVADFDQALDELFSADAAGVETTSTWSRSEIYNDHD